MCLAFFHSLLNISDGHVVDDGGDDQTISIDVMDVSDFEGQADYLQSLEDNQGDQEAVHPPSTPRHLPQRPPSRQTSNLQSQRPPSSSGGSPLLTSRSPTNRLDGLVSCILRFNLICTLQLHCILLHNVL